MKRLKDLENKCNTSTSMHRTAIQSLMSKKNIWINSQIIVTKYFCSPCKIFN